MSSGPWFSGPNCFALGYRGFVTHALQNPHLRAPFRTCRATLPAIARASTSRQDHRPWRCEGQLRAWCPGCCRAPRRVSRRWQRHLRTSHGSPTVTVRAAHRAAPMPAFEVSAKTISLARRRLCRCEHGPAARQHKRRSVALMSDHPPTATSHLGRGYHSWTFMLASFEV